MWESGWLHKIARSPSKTLTWILAFFCLGVLAGPLFLSVSSLPFLFAACVAAIAAFALPKKPRLILCAFACISFGLFRYQQSELPRYLKTVEDQIGITGRVEATVVSDVERRINGQQATVSDMRVADETVHGKMLVRFPLYPTIAYGDRLVFSCRLERPEPIEGFAYNRQLAARGILAVCPFPEYTSVRSSESSFTKNILAVRDRLIDRLRDVLPEPHASFVAGLLFGGSSSLSSQTREDFSRTGLSHILAASGFNVSLFSVVLLHLLLQSPLGRRRGLIVTSALLLFYVMLAGATPAVVRATIMAGMIVLQTGIGRHASVRNMLLLTLSGMLLFNPRLLLDDVGFQLSFVATAALLLIHPRMKHLFHAFPEAFGLRAAVSSSCVAILFTLPILLWHFGEISLFSPIANALVLPFVPLLMILGIIGLIGGAFLALPAYGLSFVLLRITQTISSLPFASLPIGSSRLLALLVTGFLIVWLIHDRYVAARTTV